MNTDNHMATTFEFMNVHIVQSSQDTDSLWLAERLELIDPHVFEQGNDGAYTRALERLAVQLRDELAIAAGLVNEHASLAGSGCACKLKGQAYCEKHDS